MFKCFGGDGWVIFVVGTYPAAAPACLPACLRSCLPDEALAAVLGVWPCFVGQPVNRRFLTIRSMLYDQSIDAP